MIHPRNRILPSPILLGIWCQKVLCHGSTLPSEFLETLSFWSLGTHFFTFTNAPRPYSTPTTEIMRVPQHLADLAHVLPLYTQNPTAHASALAQLQSQHIRVSRYCYARVANGSPVPPASRGSAWEPGDTCIWCSGGLEKGRLCLRRVEGGRGGSSRKTSQAGRWEGRQGRKSEGVSRIWGRDRVPSCWGDVRGSCWGAASRDSSREDYQRLVREAEEWTKSGAKRHEEAVAELLFTLSSHLLSGPLSHFRTATPESCKRSFHVGKPCILSVSEQTQSYCCLLCKNHGF